MIRAAVAALFIVTGAAFGQSAHVVVRVPGPGPTGQFLSATLAKSSTRVIVRDTVEITADESSGGAIVVIGRRVTVSTETTGDVIVVGGDLFLHPGGTIEGQAVAIGGAVYPSLLSSIRDGSESHRDFTFDTTRVGDVIELRYREILLDNLPTTPVSFEIRTPAYDRSNGLSLPAGAMISLAAGRFEFDPLVTYRSQLGVFDPTLRGTLRVRRSLWFDGFAGRSSRSNEKWIAGDLTNSISAFTTGRDLRNWYRAKFAEAGVNQRFGTRTVSSVLRVGGRIEDASAVGPDSNPSSSPWSITGRRTENGMIRLNPQVPNSRLSSVVGESHMTLTSTDIRGRLDLIGEVPVTTTTGERFTQFTLDGRISFPTFGNQRFQFDAHGVFTAGDTAPRQRWAYIGGSGTLPTFDSVYTTGDPPIDALLNMGGDLLLFFDSRYDIPVPQLIVPYLGAPLVTLRHILGAAGAQRLPALTQIVGFRVSFNAIRFQFLIDTRTKNKSVGVGLNLFR